MLSSYNLEPFPLELLLTRNSQEYLSNNTLRDIITLGKVYRKILTTLPLTLSMSEFILYMSGGTSSLTSPERPVTDMSYF